MLKNIFLSEKKLLNAILRAKLKHMSSKYTTPPVKMIDWGAGLPV